MDPYGIPWTYNTVPQIRHCTIDHGTSPWIHRGTMDPSQYHHGSVTVINLYNRLMVETRTANDVTQFYVLWSNFGHQVGRSGKMGIAWVTGMRPRGAGNGSHVFTASMLTVLRLIN